MRIFFKNFETFGVNINIQHQLIINISFITRKYVKYFEKKIEKVNLAINIKDSAVREKRKIKHYVCNTYMQIDLKKNK